MKNKINYNIIGATGEFFVAAEISKMGAIATLTLKNTPAIDILATNPEKGTFASIQVKTRGIDNKQGWRLTSKADNKSKIKNHFYVFVNLKENNELNEYYIIPFNEFDKFIKGKHRRWINKKKREGKPYKDGNIRNFKPESNASFFKQDVKLGKKYKNNWNTLGIFD